MENKLPAYFWWDQQHLRGLMLAWTLISCGRCVSAIRLFSSHRVSFLSIVLWCIQCLSLYRTPINHQKLEIANYQCYFFSPRMPQILHLSHTLPMNENTKRELLGRRPTGWSWSQWPYCEPSIVEYDCKSKLLHLRQRIMQKNRHYVEIKTKKQNRKGGKSWEW